MLKDTEQQYGRLSEQYAKTKAGEILQPAVKMSYANKHYNQAVEMIQAVKGFQAKAKRAIYNQDFNEAIKDQRDVEVMRLKIKKLRKTQNKNAFENFPST
jgi:hypothetical protein